MNNDSTTGNYPKALPYSSFGGEASILKMPVRRASSSGFGRAILPLEKADPGTVADKIGGLRVESLCDKDDYGRPRILSKWEAVLHALAWPMVTGVILGYSLAIFLATVHAPGGAGWQAQGRQSQVESLEDQS